MLFDASCGVCGRDGGPVCAPCAARVLPVGRVGVTGLDDAWALMAYEGVGRELVRLLKFRNRRGPLRVLAPALVGLVDPAWRFDAVTWVPAAPAHRRRRGFDQAELLARRCARVLGVRPARLLERQDGRAQTGLDRLARLDGPALRGRGPAPGNVAVVDDVLTTGGSLTAAARVLRQAGADHVVGLVLAATPAPASRRAG